MLNIKENIKTKIKKITLIGFTLGLVIPVLIETGNAVAYFGGSKEEVQAKHMVNRDKLIREGFVTQEQVDEAQSLME